jgi:hypothetical protein
MSAERIEQKLDALTKMVTRLSATVDKLATAQSTTALSDAMSAAVRQTNEIRESQAKVAAGQAKPSVENLRTGPGETQPFKDTVIKPTKDVSDPWGGAPPVETGAVDPDRPKDWVGVPRWEQGREPRVVDILRQTSKKTKGEK